MLITKLEEKASLTDLEWEYEFWFYNNMTNIGRKLQAFLFFVFNRKILHKQKKERGKDGYLGMLSYSNRKSLDL